MKTPLLILLPFFVLITCSCSKDELYYTDDDDVFDSVTLIDPLDTLVLHKAKSACMLSLNYGKTVGVFGGSLSSNIESKAAKVYWQKYLGLKVKTYGMQGHGFSSLQGSIQKQVNLASPKDIYILWCSTNDYTTNREIGSPKDFTAADNYNKSKLVTQCGGINYCIRKLRQINPQCTIYMFGSLKFFSSSDGYDESSELTNKLGYKYVEYIQKQKEIAELQGIKYFDQWDIPVVTYDNFPLFYKDDKVHMSFTGYANIAPYQLLFLATEDTNISNY